MKKFYNDIDKEKIKDSILITDYLESKGYEPVKSIKSEWLYQSMGSNENTPSFYVNVKKNRYYDYSSNNGNTGECGDIIRLAMWLENKQFIDACNFLVAGNFTPCVEFPPITPLGEEKKGIEVLNVQSLRRRSLIEYAESRRIPFSLANCCLREVDYEVNGKRFFAIGFPNDRGGYALRSSIFKGQTKPQYYSTLKGIESETINIFEGFFSMLSCLQLYGFDCFKNTTYVLNSVNNLNKLIPNIPDGVLKINAFLDNDEAGRKALEKLQRLDHLVTIDYSDRYKGYKDFNEQLLNQ